LDYDNNDRKQRSVYSRKLKAGKRRTYFFDVRETRGNDFYVTVTETRKKFNGEGFERQKIFIYKEDFNKFTDVLMQAIQHVKTELMPDFDFDHYNHEDEREEPKLRAPRSQADVHLNDNDHSYRDDRNPGEDQDENQFINQAPDNQSESDFEAERMYPDDQEGEQVKPTWAIPS
jgi:hypothetical protein